MTHRHKAAHAGGFAEGVHAAHKYTILQVGVVPDADRVGVTCTAAAAGGGGGGGGDNLSSKKGLAHRS